MTEVNPQVGAATEAVLARLESAAALPGQEIEDIGTRVSRLEAPLGPADQTAFHDFHHIEFAFESVWSEVYDKEFIRDVANLHTTLGRVRRFAGYEADDPELVNWVEDLEGQLDDIEGEANEAENVEDPSYELVVAVFPTMSPALWNWIGTAERARFFNFCLEYRSRPAPQDADKEGLVESVLGEAGGFVDDAIDFVGGAVEDVGDFFSGLF